MNFCCSLLSFRHLAFFLAPSSIHVVTRLYDCTRRADKHLNHVSTSQSLLPVPLVHLPGPPKVVSSVIARRPYVHASRIHSARIFPSHRHSCCLCVYAATAGRTALCMISPAMASLLTRLQSQDSELSSEATSQRIHNSATPLPATVKSCSQYLPVALPRLRPVSRHPCTTNHCGLALATST